MSSRHEMMDGAVTDFRYWAFISYSERDVKWARWLHKELETYRVPRAFVGRQVGGRTIGRRLVPVFRDRDELPSSGDLGGKIREALEASYALIVICSPYAAASPWVNEEVRAFKALGRSERVFPLIVDGEPYASERPHLGLPECFPPSLRFAVAADGTLTDRRSDPLAADAREGKDGRANAMLKLIAGILGIGFDDLRNRELARQRQRRLIGVLASAVAGVAMAAIYIGLADSDINVVGGAAIRRALDRHELSVFRPVASHEADVRAASAARNQLRQRLLDPVALSSMTVRQDYSASVWSLGQVAGAVFRDPNATDGDIKLLAPMLDRVFQDDFLLKADGNPIGWPGDGPLPRVETALWAMMALTQALRRNGGEIELHRASFTAHVETVQQIAENYYPMRDGGWNVAMQSKFEEHNFYSSALALHAMLELDSAHLCWRGSCERLRQMIRETSQWLIANFVDEKRVTGWRRTLDDDGAPDPELSVMIYAGLARAQVDIPDNIRNAALQQLIDLRRRPYDPAHHDIRHWVTYVNDSGKWESLSIPTRVLWYPWATQALINWVHYAEQENFPPEIQLALARSLGHVVVEDSDDMLDDMSHAALFSVAETCYGLGSVR